MKSRKSLILHAIVATIALVSLNDSVCADYTAAELLQRYAEVAQQWEHVELSAETAGSYFPDDQSPGVPYDEEKFTLVMSAGRSHYLSRRINRYPATRFPHPPDVKMIEESNLREEVLKPDSAVVLDRNPDLSFNDPNDPATLMAWMKGPNEFQKGTFINELGVLLKGPSLAAGRSQFQFNCPAIQFVAEISRAETPKRLDEGKWSVRLRSRWGLCTVTLDEQRNLCPLSIRLEKRANDWYNMEGASVEKAKLNDLYYPQRPLTQWRGGWDFLEYRQVDGKWFPHRILGSSHFRFQDGRQVHFETQTVVSDVRFHPSALSDDKFQMVSAIPNGSIVYVEDNPGVQYEWKDGQILKSYDPALTQPLCDLPIRPSRIWRDTPWLLPGMVGIGLLAMAGLWKLILFLRTR